MELDEILSMRAWRSRSKSGLHFDVPLTSSRVRVSILSFILVVAIIVSVVVRGGGGGVVDRGSVGRTEFMRRGYGRFGTTLADEQRSGERKFMLYSTGKSPKN